MDHFKEILNYSRQPSCQAVVKAGNPEPVINTSCKRLKNSWEMKMDEIPSEKLTAPDGASLTRESCSEAWETVILPQ